MPEVSENSEGEMQNAASFERISSINRIINETEALYHAAALKMKLSDSALFVLYMLCDGGGRCKLNEIHGAGVCKQTVNSAVRKLEKEGLLYLEPYSGKAKLAVLTEKGKEFTDRTVIPLFEAEEAVFSNWSEEEAEAYVRLSRKYLEGFRQRIENLHISI